MAGARLHCARPSVAAVPSATAICAAKAVLLLPSTSDLLCLAIDVPQANVPERQLLRRGPSPQTWDHEACARWIWERLCGEECSGGEVELSELVEEGLREVGGWVGECSLINCTVEAAGCAAEPAGETSLSRVWTWQMGRLLSGCTGAGWCWPGPQHCCPHGCCHQLHCWCCCCCRWRATPPRGTAPHGATATYRAGSPTCTTIGPCSTGAAAARRRSARRGTSGGRTRAHRRRCRAASGQCWRCSMRGMRR